MKTSRYLIVSLTTFALLVSVFLSTGAAQSQDATRSQNTGPIYLNSSMLKGYALKAASGNTRDNGWVQIVKLQGDKEQVMDSVRLQNMSYCAGDTNGIAILDRRGAIRSVIFARFGSKVKYDTVYKALQQTPQDHFAGRALLCASLKDSVLVMATNDSGRMVGTQVVRIKPRGGWEVELESPMYAAPSMTYDFKQLLLVNYPPKGSKEPFGTLYTYDLATRQNTTITAAGDSIMIARQLYRGLPIVYVQYSGDNVNLYWTDGTTTKQFTDFAKPLVVGTLEIRPELKVLRYNVYNLTKPGQPDSKDIPFSQLGW